MISSLLLFISFLILLVVVFIAFKLIDIEHQMSMAKVHNDVTQKIPVRRRRRF